MGDDVTMEHTAVAKAAMKIHSLTGLNTYVIDQQTEFIFYKEAITVPTFMPGSQDQDVYAFYKQIKAQSLEQTFIFVNDWGLYYLGYPFFRQENYIIIIGPFMILTPDIFYLTRTYQISSQERESLQLFSQQIHVLNKDEMQSHASLLQLFDELIDTSDEPILLKNNSETDDSAITSPPTRLEEEETELIQVRYKIENDILYAVEYGNKTQALKLFKDNHMLFSFSERLPNMPLRRIKNLTIVFNTLLRTAAKNAQVPSLFIHRLSEKYAIAIEQAKKLSELMHYQEKIIADYCDLVQNQSLSGYTNMTQQAIEEIMTNYDKKLDIQALAKLCFTHPSHLSRKFKQETGQTITDFHQMIRIDHAKHMLKHENLPVSEIAWLVGYEDASYFTRVFKKNTGYTPTEYRNQRGENFNFK